MIWYLTVFIYLKIDCYYVVLVHFFLMLQIHARHWHEQVRYFITIANLAVTQLFSLLYSFEGNARYIKLRLLDMIFNTRLILYDLRLSTETLYQPM